MKALLVSPGAVSVTLFFEEGVALGDSSALFVYRPGTFADGVCLDASDCVEVKPASDKSAPVSVPPIHGSEVVVELVRSGATAKRRGATQLRAQDRVRVTSVISGIVDTARLGKRPANITESSTVDKADDAVGEEAAGALEGGPGISSMIDKREGRAMKMPWFRGEPGVCNIDVPCTPRVVRVPL